MALGNVISQTLIEKRELKDFDWARLGRFASAGLFFVGPFFRYWFYGLERYFAGATLQPLKMMVVDQLFSAPLINATLISYLSLTGGASIKQTKERLCRDFPGIMKANYTVWPAIQLTNFYFVPLQHRTLFVNICMVLWSSFLAYKTK
ncbi:unnamed protein product [Rotaria sp. Silwood1]|nr:unnamed protein product [Rotaria sp. Silwood1]CAF1668718.1 unnamed protein product [Rotaria sp. Silwood1]